MNSFAVALVVAFLGLFAAVASGCANHGHHHHDVHGHGHGHTHDQDDKRRLRTLGQHQHHHSHVSHSHGHDNDIHEHDDDRLSSTEERQRELRIGGDPMKVHGWRNEREFREGGGRCQTPNPTAAEAESANRAVANWMAIKSIGFPGHSRLLQQATKVIPIHFHIVHRNDGTFGGVPFDVQESVNILNAAFFGYGTTAAFRFELTTITGPHLNTEWYNADQAVYDTDPERVMKSTLRIGGPADLNIYVTSGGGYLGW